MCIRDRFSIHFPSASDSARQGARFVLSENRRSGPSILEVANRTSSSLRAVHAGVEPLRSADNGKGPGVVACALFAAVSGSSPATVVAIGAILLPAMVKQGYPKQFGAGVVATSGALGILIPPSIVMVIYSVATAGSVALGPTSLLAIWFAEPSRFQRSNSLAGVGVPGSPASSSKRSLKSVLA